MVSKENNTLTVKAPVLIPNYADCDYLRGETPLTREQIQEFEKNFREYAIIEKNHDYIRTHESVGKPIKSEILEEPTTLTLVDGSTKEYPSGTWILTTEITDADTIEKVLSGTYTGFSITVLPEETAKKLIATKASMSNLIKDIPNPVAFAVSLVRKPCVTDAKLIDTCQSCSLKFNKQEEVDVMEDKTKLDKIKNILGMKEDAVPEYATKEDLTAFKEEILEEIKADVISAMKEALKEPKKKETKEPKKEGQCGCAKATPKPDEEGEDEEPKPDDEKPQQNKASGKECNKKKQSATKSQKVHNTPVATKSDAQRFFEVFNAE